MPLRFSAEIIEWRGPSPFYFASIPDELTGEIREEARIASYGWGVVPVDVTIDGIEFTTSLFPRDGNYLLPLKDAVRRKVGMTVGDNIAMEFSVRARK